MLYRTLSGVGVFFCFWCWSSITSVEQSIQGVIVIDGLIFPEGGSVTAIIRELFSAGKMLIVGAKKMT